MISANTIAAKKIDLTSILSTVVGNKSVQPIELPLEDGNQFCELNSIFPGRDGNTLTSLSGNRFSPAFKVFDNFSPSADFVLAETSLIVHVYTCLHPRPSLYIILDSQVFHIMYVRVRARIDRRTYVPKQKEEHA